MTWKTHCYKCKTKRTVEGKSVGEDVALLKAEGWRFISVGQMDVWHCASCAKEAEKVGGA